MLGESVSNVALLRRGSEKVLGVDFPWIIACGWSFGWSGKIANRRGERRFEGRCFRLLRHSNTLILI